MQRVRYAHWALDAAAAAAQCSLEGQRSLRVPPMACYVDASATPNARCPLLFATCRYDMSGDVSRIM